MNKVVIKSPKTAYPNKIYMERIDLYFFGLRRITLSINLHRHFNGLNSLQYLLMHFHTSLKQSLKVTQLLRVLLTTRIAHTTHQNQTYIEQMALLELAQILRWLFLTLQLIRQLYEIPKNLVEDLIQLGGTVLNLIQGETRKLLDLAYILQDLDQSQMRKRQVNWIFGWFCELCQQVLDKAGKTLECVVDEKFSDAFLDELVKYAVGESSWLLRGFKVLEEVHEPMLDCW